MTTAHPQPDDEELRQRCCELAHTSIFRFEDIFDSAQLLAERGLPLDVLEKLMPAALAQKSPSLYPLAWAVVNMND